jgi:hypothetical protein
MAYASKHDRQLGLTSTHIITSACLLQAGVPYVDVGVKEGDGRKRAVQEPYRFLLRAIAHAAMCF